MRSTGRLLRVLIVNCYFDDSRQSLPRPGKLPLPMGPAYLAGALSRERCDVRVYCEMASGPLHDAGLLAWPDMLVLTGITCAFDRMLHLAAYARSLNPKVVIAAGGPAIRAIPQFARRYFDYCCLGDVEELGEIARQVFGSEFAAEQCFPRFDLAYWIGTVAHLESSRNCNFRCGFCSLTAEGRGFRRLSLDYFERQLQAVERRQIALLIDNNFYGNDRPGFLDRVGVLRRMWLEKRFLGWGALVTGDFFLNPDNLPLVAESGCVGLFSGVESFDVEWLNGMNKAHNTRSSAADVIRQCLESGLVFVYGMMLDVSSRRAADLKAEIEWVLSNPMITLPSYYALATPLPGTPWFYDCLGERKLLPNTKWRDLEGTTMCVQPLDSIEELRPLLSHTQQLTGYSMQVLKHQAKLLLRYGRKLSPVKLRALAKSEGMSYAYGFVSNASAWVRGRKPWAETRTFISTTEILDPVYRPALPIEPRYQHYFRPTMLTLPNGELNEELAADLGSPKQATAALSMPGV
ncbi:MAG: cobalamin-dependent protein [Acidobacteria bacterium]|nr:cobalamin-dependent protein [Acidobacteriota bacterium]